MVRDEEFRLRIAGKQHPAYYARPNSGTNIPGLVVLHEVTGLNDNIRLIARRLAGEGYAALAVDLFPGAPMPVCLIRYLTDQFLRPMQNGTINILRETLDILARMPDVDGHRLGAIGFCMGAGYALAWASGDQRLRAIAPFYGKNPRPLSVLENICPVVGSYPENDTYPLMHTHRDGHELKVELTRHNVAHDIKFYPGTNHSFCNANFNAEATDDAFQRVVAFFAKHLA